MSSLVRSIKNRRRPTRCNSIVLVREPGSPFMYPVRRSRSTGSVRSGAATGQSEGMPIHTFNSDLFIRDAVCELIETERQYNQNLRLLIGAYSQPLRCYELLSQSEHQDIFDPLLEICEISTRFNAKLLKLRELEFEKVDWDLRRRIANYRSLLTKLEEDQAFASFSSQQTAFLGLSLLDLFQLPEQRLVSYEQWLHRVIDETESSHPDMPQMKRTLRLLSDSTPQQYESALELPVYRSGAEQPVITGTTWQERRSTLQDDGGKLSTKISSIGRRRSLPSSSPIRQLAQRFAQPGANPAASMPDHQPFGSKPGSSDTNNNGQRFSRTYIKEGPVVLTMGLHCYERYLFLFNDLLLIAKEKSRNSYKLKEKIRLCEVWVSDEGHEQIASADVYSTNSLSFVIGWPVTNYVAKFGNPIERDSWLVALQQQIAHERDREPVRVTSLRLQYRHDKHSGDETVKVLVNNQQNANDILKIALSDLEDIVPLPPGPCCDWLDSYQLCVYSTREHASCPLIGHESPFAIAMSHVRDVLQPEMNWSLSANQLENLADISPSDLRCTFVVQPKSTKKSGRRSHVMWDQFKRRVLKSDSVDSALSPSPPLANTPTGRLFGHSLSTLSTPECPFPRPVLTMITYLFRNALYLEGIFRKTPKASAVKQLRDHLDHSDEAVCFNAPFVVASLLKDYLRSLPESLLLTDRFEDWINLVTNSPDVEGGRRILATLPRPHYELLRYLLCLLHHITLKQQYNQMTAANLAICFGHSLLAQPSADLGFCESTRRIPDVTFFLIDSVVELFGSDTLTLLGAPPPISNRSSIEDSEVAECFKQAHDASSVDSLIGSGGTSSRPESSLHSAGGPHRSHDSGLADHQMMVSSTDESEHSSSNASASLATRPSCFSEEEVDGPVAPPRRPKCKPVGTTLTVTVGEEDEEEEEEDGFSDARSGARRSLKRTDGTLHRSQSGDRLVVQETVALPSNSSPDASLPSLSSSGISSPDSVFISEPLARNTPARRPARHHRPLGSTRSNEAECSTDNEDDPISLSPKPERCVLPEKTSRQLAEAIVESSDESTPHVSRESSCAQEFADKADRMFSRGRSTGLLIDTIKANATATDSDGGRSEQLTPTNEEARTSLTPYKVEGRSMTPPKEIVFETHYKPPTVESPTNSVRSTRYTPAARPPSNRQRYRPRQQGATTPNVQAVVPLPPLIFSSQIRTRLPTYEEAVSRKHCVSSYRSFPDGRPLIDSTARRTNTYADRPPSDKPAVNEAPAVIGVQRTGSIALCPEGQVRRRIERYDRTNIRRKTLGGGENLDAIPRQISQPVEPTPMLKPSAFVPPRRSISSHYNSAMFNSPSGSPVTAPSDSITLNPVSVARLKQMYCSENGSVNDDRQQSTVVFVKSPGIAQPQPSILTGSYCNYPVVKPPPLSMCPPGKPLRLAPSGASTTTITRGETARQLLRTRTPSQNAANNRYVGTTISYV